MKSSVKHSGIVIAFLFCGLSAWGQTTGNITGNWKSEIKDKPLEMEIYLATDNAYYGKIINDKNNPSKNGTLTLKKLKYDQASQTFTGTMRPPDANMEVDVTVSIIDNDRLKLIVRKLFITRNVYLTRIKTNK